MFKVHAITAEWLHSTAVAKPPQPTVSSTAVTVWSNPTPYCPRSTTPIL